jgi:hypothetical protein
MGLIHLLSESVFLRRFKVFSPHFRLFPGELMRAFSLTPTLATLIVCTTASVFQALPAATEITPDPTPSPTIA